MNLHASLQSFTPPPQSCPQKDIYIYLFIYVNSLFCRMYFGVDASLEKLWKREGGKTKLNVTSCFCVKALDWLTEIKETQRRAETDLRSDNETHLLLTDRIFQTGDLKPPYCWIPHSSWFYFTFWGVDWILDTMKCIYDSFLFVINVQPSEATWNRGIGPGLQAPRQDWFSYMDSAAGSPN